MAVFNIEGYNSYSGCDITVTATLPMINGESPGKYYTLGSIQTLSISTHQDKRPVRSLGVINAKDYVMGPRTIAGSMVFAVFNKHFASEIMADLGASAGKDVVLPDEIPALDITINFANEYGRMSRMAIYGVKLINEGQVMSINDLYTENTYQFVALGLEPITAENGKADGTGDWEKSGKPTPKTNYDLAIEPSMYTQGMDDKEFEDNSGANIANQIKNNNGLVVNNLIEPETKLPSNVAIELSAEATDAESEIDLGLVVFILKPIQINGYIYIYKGTEKTSTPDYTLAVTKKTSHNMFLPIGNYTAQYSDLSSNTSNIVNFSIGVKDKKDKIINDDVYPIIDKVTHDSMTVTNNDTRFDTLNIFESGGEIQSYNIGKKPLTLVGLNPDSDYNLFVSNSLSDKSNVVTVKTFEYKDQELDMLKDYIKDNKNLFTGDIEKIFEDLDEINMNDHNTIIDAVQSLPESPEKEEALIYASALTNQLIQSYNSSNPNNITHNIQKHPFSNTIEINDYNKAAVYISSNRKNTLNQIIDTTDDKFFGIPSKHYFVQGLDDENRASIKKDFIILKNGDLERLKEYTHTERYLEIDLEFYNDMYKKYSANTIQAMAILDNCYSTLDLLEPPYIYQSNGEIYADVNYTNLKKTNTYYLVCAELHDALDSKPFRKVPFTISNDTLVLDDYYLGLIKKNNYLFWIENSNYLKISKPYIFRYHDAYDIKDEFDNIYKTELFTIINKLQAKFNTSNLNNNTTKELFNFVYDLEPQKKNFMDTLIVELLNHYSSSIYEKDMTLALFEILKIFNQNNKINSPFHSKIDIQNKCIEIKLLEDFYICAISITENGVSRIIESDDIVFFGNEGYVMIYLINNSEIYHTGFILINCKTNKYHFSEELENYIKEGVIY